MKKQLASLIYKPIFWLAGEVLDELPNLRKPFINSLVPVAERVYPSDHNLRPQTIVHHLKRYWFATTVRKPQGLALDYACGSGYGTEILSEAGYKATGWDINPEAMLYARKHFPKCRFAKPKGKYDLITFFEAIEHFEKEEGKAVLQSLKDSLTKNGTLLVSVPVKLDLTRNGFHKSHWNRYALDSYLGTLFKTVGVIYQDWDTGEIGPVEPDFFIFICKK